MTKIVMKAIAQFISYEHLEKTAIIIQKHIEKKAVLILHIVPLREYHSKICF